MNDYDVVIVGGRVAGASTALLLARAGLRVAVVERSRLGSDTVSTHALDAGGVLQLSRWGVLPELVAAGTPAIRRTAFHYADGGTTRVSRCGRARGRRAVRATPSPPRPRARRSSRGLGRRRAARDAGGGAAPRRRRARPRRPHPRRPGRRGSRSGPASPSAPTGSAPSSRARSAHEVREPVAARPARSSTATSTEVPSTGYVWGYGDGAAAGLIPTNAGQTCVFVATTPARMRPLRRDGADAAFDSLLDAVPAALSDAVRAGGPCGRVHGWRGVPGHVRRSFGPGWALVGDAGYFKDPITTHGITDALRDAELLSDAVLAGLGRARPR